MDLPERQPSPNTIRLALDDLQRLGGAQPAAPFEATANALADAARLAPETLAAIADTLRPEGPAVSSAHDAFIAAAVVAGRTVLWADPVLQGHGAHDALADAAVLAPSVGRRFALLHLPGGRTPVCVAAAARRAAAWPLPPDARMAAAGAPGATAILVFLASSIDDFAALLQRAFALTAAEARLGAILADSPTIKEVARRLGIAPDTVKGRMRDLMAKTGAPRRSALAARFTEFVAGDYTRTHARAALLREAFGLTRAEARVADSVADGRTTLEIARIHAVSPHTVRAQLDSALARTGARRGADLARIAAETCALASWTSGGEHYLDDQRRLLAATRLVVTPDRRRIAAADFGPPGGAPVLHFHPNFAFRWVRRALADALAARDLRSVGYDRAGSGLSDPAPGLHPFEAAARDAASVLAAYRIERVRLFAALGGAAAAIAFAARYPHMVESAVLLMPRATGEEPVFPGAVQRLYAGVLSVPGVGERLADAVRRTGSAGFWRWVQAYALRDNPSDAAAIRDPAFLDERLAELNAAISRGVRGPYEWEQAYRGGWPRPTAIGGRSWTIVETAVRPFGNKASAQESWGWLPGARFVKLHGAGRLANFTHAADLADLIGGRTALAPVRLAG